MMNLTNMRIGKRLAVGFGIAIVLAIAIAATGWWAIQSINTAGSKALAQGTRNLERSKAMEDISLVYILMLKGVTAADKEHRDQYQVQLTETRERLKSELTEIENGTASAEARQLAENLTAAAAAQRETNDRAWNLAAIGKRDEALQLMHGEGGVHMAASLTVAQQLADRSEKQRNELIEEQAAITTRARWILGILSPGCRHQRSLRHLYHP